MATDIVASLQLVGADVVASLQFPTAVTPPTGGGGFAGSLYAPRRRTLRDQLEEEDAEEARRAAEIAEAAISRAAAEPPSSLAGLVAPASLKALAEPAPLELPPVPVVVQTVTVEVTQGPSPAVLDEDAILAATVLLMRRRRG